MPGRWRRRVLGVVGRPETYVVATDEGVEIVMPSSGRRFDVDEAFQLGLLVLSAGRESIRLTLKFRRSFPRLRPVRAPFGVGDRLRSKGSGEARRVR